jgi:hypothetical protein
MGTSVLVSCLAADLFVISETHESCYARGMLSWNSPCFVETRKTGNA